MRFPSKTNINFISKQKFTAFISVVLIIAGITSLVMKGGPLLSIDFTGGTIAQVKFNKTVEITGLRTTLSEYGFKGAEIVEFGSPDEVLIKTQISGSTAEISEKLITALGNTLLRKHQYYTHKKNYSSLRLNLEISLF